MLVQIQSIHAKLVLSLISLLLLALVTNSGSGSFLQKSLAVSDTHIVASGDWHCTIDAQKTVNMAKSMNPQLILGLGDYSSEKTETCWVNLIKPVASITKIALGNHDVEHDGLADSYLKHYGLSKQFYSFDIKNVHVLTMATEEKFEAGSEQYNFVVNDLRKAANNPDIKWIIVTMHSPFYSSPNECNDSDCTGNEELSEIYHPLFDKYGIDLVLQAHVRNYQRSFPLEFNQESPSKPIVTSTSKGEYKNPDGIIFAIVGTGGGELKHDLKGLSPFMAYQQDSKFGILDMHFLENNLDAKFVSNDGATMDHFSIVKTAKKAVIERISDDIFTDTNVRTVSDKETTKAKPLAGQAQVREDKPSVTFKLDEDATTDTKAKPLAGQAQVQQGQPSVTFKLDEDATTDTKAKPLAGQAQVREDKPSVTFKLDEDATTDTKAKPLTEQVQQGQPSITFKLDEDAAAANTKAKPLAGQEIQEDKPAMTAKLDSNPPKDDKPMLLSEEQVEQEQDKPAMTAKLDSNPPKDDKPMSLGKEKVDSSDKEKSASFQTSDNVDKSHVQDLLGTLDNNTPIADEVSDSDKEMTSNTNQRDPFASLN
jgi:Calcineurin-like phosphoesterase